MWWCRLQRLGDWMTWAPLMGPAPRWGPSTLSFPVGSQVSGLWFTLNSPGLALGEGKGKAPLYLVVVGNLAAFDKYHNPRC